MDGFRTARWTAFGTAVICCLAIGCSPIRRDEPSVSFPGLGELVDFIATRPKLFQREPTLYRPWRPDLAVLPTADFEGNHVVIHNVRNCRYRTEDDYDTRHYDIEFELDEVERVDFIIVPFKGNRLLAHTMLSFGLRDGRHFVLSVEARLAEGETYTTVSGPGKKFELMYLIADERDIIPLRTEVRQVDVHLYRGRTTPERAQVLLLDVLYRTNKLAREPEFYDILRNNCTTNLVDHVNKLRPGAIPFDWRVVLPGDGGSMKPMTRALARSMQLMGGQVSSDLQGQLVDKELENAKNVALVFVTATIPPAGAQAGEKLACSVSAISAKSLEGGILMQTPLLGPRADQPQVYALAQGPITIDNVRLPTTGRVASGCKMEATVETEFVADNAVTIVLKPSHASFEMAQDIEDLINSRADELVAGIKVNSSGTTRSKSMSSGRSGGAELLATALDQTHVHVKIPNIYRDRPVQFIDMILSLPLIVGNRNRSVVIREREGVITIGEDVTIAPVAISHKNLMVSTRNSRSVVNGFVGVGYERQTASNEQATLRELVKALDTLAVTTDDMIAIIKAIERQGNLFGELIIE